MIHNSPWHQLFNMTGKMVLVAQKEAWDELVELQVDRDKLIATLPAPTSTDADLLQQILTLNQTLEQLSASHQDQLAGTIRQGQKNLQGISAYQTVTEDCY